MRSQTGLVLRLLGPLIEVVGIATLFQIRGRRYVVLGIEGETLCYAAIVVGFALVVVGLTVGRTAPKPKDKWDVPRDRSLE